MVTICYFHTQRRIKLVTRYFFLFFFWNLCSKTLVVFCRFLVCVSGASVWWLICVVRSILDWWYFDVVLGDPAVGMSLADLVHGFSDGWFCTGIRAWFHMSDLGASWRVFFIITGIREILKKCKHYFTVLPLSPQNILSYLVCEFDDTLSKLMTKCINRLVKLLLHFFSHVSMKWEKN